MPQFRLISREIPLPLYRMGMYQAEDFARYAPIYDIKIEKGELLELRAKPESKTEKPKTSLIFLGREKAYQGIVLVGSPYREIGEVVESALHALYSRDEKIFDPSVKWDNPDSNERWGIYELVRDDDENDLVTL